MKAFKQIPAHHEGDVSTAEMMARGMAKCASQEHGVVKLNYIETLLAVQQRGSSFGDTVAERVQALAPEYAARAHDWHRQKSMVERVSGECYRDMIAYMEEKSMTEPPTPSNWLRPTWVLQPGDRKQKDNISAVEQRLTIKRWLCELSSLTKSNDYDYRIPRDLHAAQRTLNEE